MVCHKLRQFKVLCDLSKKSNQAKVAEALESMASRTMLSLYNWILHFVKHVGHGSGIFSKPGFHPGGALARREPQKIQTFSFEKNTPTFETSRAQAVACYFPAPSTFSLDTVLCLGWEGMLSCFVIYVFQQFFLISRCLSKFASTKAHIEDALVINSE